MGGGQLLSMFLLLFLSIKLCFARYNFIFFSFSEFLFYFIFQMLHGLHTQEALKQLKAEGFYYLYRGILPPLCQKTVSVSLMFGMYDHYHQGLRYTFQTGTEE